MPIDWFNVLIAWSRWSSRSLGEPPAALASARLRRVDLAGQQLVVGPRDAGHGHALADVVAAQARADLCCEVDDLARIARRVRVRYVVAGCLQRRVGRRQPAATD